ncbi:DUF2089 domain-containing protein [bacterium]|nr:DUF2089 domain-containing protein [bacterium]
MNLCPSCGGYLRVRKKICTQCGLQLEADFAESPLVMLAREEQDFLFDFIQCRGNIKLLCERLDLTYPTARTYLDRIADKLEALSRAGSIDKIIEAIDRGEIHPDEGIEKLRKLRREENGDELAS